MSRRQLSYDAQNCDQYTQDQLQVEQLACVLCEVSHTHMSRVSTWHSSQAYFTVSQYGITEDDVVCQLCRDDVHRVAANPSSHTPRWEKRMHEKKCCVKECKSVYFTQTKATDKNP